MKRWTTIPWLDERLPDSAPKGWQLLDQRDDGVAFVKSEMAMVPTKGKPFGGLDKVAGMGVLIVGSEATETDTGKVTRWIQCVVTWRERKPNWEEMHEVRKAFFGPNSNWVVNLAPEELEKRFAVPNTVHMFACLNRRVCPIPLQGLVIQGVDLQGTPDLDRILKQ